MNEKITFTPQKGPQSSFLNSRADIALYGGSAGGGKSFALLLEPLRNIHNKDFGAVCFRRTMPQIKNEGGLFDESAKIYPYLRGVPNLSEVFWKFKSGCTISFTHLEHDKTVYNFQGAQIPLLMYDELTHFTRHQFFYMMSRNRSTCGVKPYIRATTNPDKKSWVRKFIDWWIDIDGYPIQDRSGIERYFLVENDSVLWESTRDAFKEKSQFAKSFTFIPAKLSDNKILMQKDPGYLANLMAQSRVERMKLLDGNWDAEESAGEMFAKHCVKITKAVPSKIIRTIRYWDRAASEKETADWTVGLKLAQLENGQYCILDVIRFRGTPGKVKDKIKNTAILDTNRVEIGLEKDPGQAGEADIEYLVKELAGFSVKTPRATQDKVTRAQPVSTQWEHGNIVLLEGKWNDEFVNELDSFPQGDHDDQVDTLSGAFNLFINSKTGSFTAEMAKPHNKPTLRGW